MKAQELGNTVRIRREELGVTQEALAKSLGRSRQWLAQVEMGRRYGTGTPVPVGAGMALQLASALELDPAELLTLADVPRNKWPDLSNFRSNPVRVTPIDISMLTETQARLVEDLVTEFKTGNKTHDNPENGE